MLPRAAKVKDGRRPPPEAARSVLDRSEHGGMIVRAGGAKTANRYNKS